MKPYLRATWIFAFLTNAAFAQPDNLSLHIFGSASLPNGDFARDIGDNARITRRAGFDVGEKVGLAQTGFGGGVELNSPVWFKGLHWVISARAFVNGSDEATVQSEFRSQLGSASDLQLEFGQWLNVPIMTGIRYDYGFSQKIAVYGILQAGLNWSKAASRKATVGALTVEDTRYEFARDFGLEAGLGLLFRQRYNIGFRYLALDTPRYEGTRTLSEKQFPEIFSRKNAILGEERSISMFVVTLGVELFR